MNNSKKRLTLKQRKLINAAIIVIAVLIIVGVNILATVLVNRFPALEADVTSTGAYSLNATTEEYLRYMENEVKVSVLMTEENFTNRTDDSGSASYYYQVDKLLKEMSVYENFTLEFKDISAASASKLSSQYPDIDWTSTDNLILVECGDKYKMLTTTDVFSFSEEYAYYYGMNVISGQSIEQCMLTTIQKLTATDTLKIALTTGNSEFLNEQHQKYSSYSGLEDLLEDNAYEVVELNLLTEELSEDIDALLMVAPSVDITNEQSEKINDWLINGGDYGKTFMYVPFDFTESTKNMDLLLEQWGMKIKKGYIYENDLTMALSGSSTPQLTSIVNYADETFTEDLKTTALPLIMPYSMGVEITDDTVATAMLTSSDTADLLLLNESTEEAVFEESTGEALNYAAIGKKGNDDLSKVSNFIVWGSYDAVSDSAINSTNFNNAAYFVNIFNTTLGNEAEAIVIDSVGLGYDSLTVSSAQQVAVFVIFVVIIPLAVFAVGIVVWVRRKNR